MIMDEDDRAMLNGGRNNDERMDEDEGRRDEAADEDNLYSAGVRTQQTPWFFPSFFSHRNAAITTTTTTTTTAGAPNRPFTRVVSSDGRDSRSTPFEDTYTDCREDIAMERDSGEQHLSTEASRIHEPLKRYEADGGYSSENTATSNKRRRIGEAACMAYFNAVPTFTERQQVVVEFFGPITLAPMLYSLGSAPPMVLWGFVFFIIHFFQCAVTSFGPDTKSWSIKPWISPLGHFLIDSYVCNNSMISLALLRPDLFGASGYTFGAAFVFQQQLYLAYSMKAYYLSQIKPNISNKEHQKDIELHFVEIILIYALADILFVLAKFLSLRYLLWAGLLIFNVCPLYLIWAFKKRRDEYYIVKTTNGKIASKKGN